MSEEVGRPRAEAGVERRHLGTAALGEAIGVDRVETVEVTMGPGRASGRHLHPCPVVGQVTRGTILFQVEGGPQQHLGPGDAFYEPANTPVAHFDNVGEGPATFVANYLLVGGQNELIRMLPPQ
jgi:quercetin dioxygenase-like cupin family protein